MYIREINEFTIIWGKLNMKRKIACVLLGAVSLQLLSCGQHGSNETLTEPNYVLQEYETTKSENGYSIVNDFMVYDEPSPSGLYVYYPYVEEKKKGVNYLDDMYIRGNSARDEELQGEARPDGTSSKIGNSACDSMIVNAWSTPDFALKYNSDSSKGVGDERVGFAFSYLINDGDKEYKSGDDAMADVDVAAYSFALYEDFKDYGGPVCTVEVYGVPQALFKEKLGKKFNSDELYDFLDKLKPAEKFLTLLSRFIKILSVLVHSLQIFQNYIYTDWFGNMSVHTRFDCLFTVFFKSIGSHRNF